MGYINKSNFDIVALVIFVLQICVIQSSDEVEDVINKRSLNKDDYTDIKRVSLQFIYKDDENLYRHKRDAEPPESPVELHIYGEDEIFEISLEHTKPAVSKGARVVVSNGDKQTTDVIEPRDCFMSGRLKSNPSDTAVFSFCDGVRGGFTNGAYSYFVQGHEDDEGDIKDVLLTRKEKKDVYDTYEPLSHYTQKLNVGGRERRSLGNIVVETVVILDEEYIANIRAAGHATNQSIVDLMTLKWTGVAAEWAKVDQLEYDVTVDIKEIVIWETNPDWYSPSNTLDDTLLSICYNADDRGLWADFDHIHLFTGRSGTDVSGKAYLGEICKDGWKCAVSTDTSIAEYYIPAHELGHSLGMHHDGDVGCSSPDIGIMGGVTSGWSTCSVNSFKTLMSSASADCLEQTNVVDSPVFTVNSVWPGMAYTDDEICALQNGEGFVYKGSVASCSGYSCINLDTSSDKYGVSFRYTAPTDGRYCGEDMVCTTSQAIYRCINVTDTDLDPALITKVTGVWSDWGSVTSCSRTCGTGVQYRERTCDNPKPQNSALCEGDRYDAELCNTQPCSGDSSVESELIIQRAGEACSRWKTDDMYAIIGQDSSNYLTTGEKRGNSDDDQCEVLCATVDGYTAANSERHGLMPDGTPCTHSSLSSFVEKNNLPRKSGMFGTCVQGYCYLFGCDNNSGSTQRDGCGVCGGDNSTCQIVEDIYDTELATSTRERIVMLPAQSSLIQVYFTYNSMQSHFLELKTKDAGTSEFGANVISGLPAKDTISNPVNFAGTYWYVLWSKAYMYAEGPIDQAVDVVLYNYGSKINAGVTYEYSMPTAPDMASCTGTCDNGGTWNSSMCSCDCVDGYYGVSCDTTCKKICGNGQSLSPSGCQCDCQGNTYVTACSCRYPFTGLDCQDCKISSCQNGGTFNATACRCTCPQGYGSLDCSTSCEDAGLTTDDCIVKVGKGHCDSKNEVMEEKCYKSCNLCEPADTTTQTTATTQSQSTATGQTTVSTQATTVNETNADNGAGSLLVHWSNDFIPLPLSLLIHWSPWILVTQSLLTAMLLL